MIPLICIDGFNDELSVYVPWNEYINITRSNRKEQREQFYN
jgi:hypothetical protein